MEKETSPGLVGLDQGSTAATIQRRVSAEHEETKFEVPCYDQDALYFQDNRDLDQSSINEVGRLLLNILDNMFKVNQLLSLKDYRDVLDVVNKWENNYAVTLGYEASMLKKPKEFWQMLAELELSIRTSTSNEEITSEEALSRFRILRGGISRLIYHSPWGAYLRWNELKINQQTLIEYLAPAIRKLKESGGKAFLLLLTEVFRTAHRREPPTS